MRIKWLGLALVLGLLALPAAAQVQKGNWEISPMVGYAWHGAGLDDGFAASLSVGYNFTEA